MHLYIRQIDCTRFWNYFNRTCQHSHYVYAHQPRGTPATECWKALPQKSSQQGLHNNQDQKPSIARTRSTSIASAWTHPVQLTHVRDLPIHRCGVQLSWGAGVPPAVLLRELQLQAKGACHIDCRAVLSLIITIIDCICITVLQHKFDHNLIEWNTGDASKSDT